MIDVNSLINIYCDYINLHKRLDSSFAKNFNKRVARKYLHDKIKSKCILTLNIKDRIIGLVIFNVTDSKLRILDFVIKKNLRNKGYGTELMNKVIEYAKNNGCTNITLKVHVKNKKALDFYLKNSFNSQSIELYKEI